MRENENSLHEKIYSILSVSKLRSWNIYPVYLTNIMVNQAAVTRSETIDI